MRPTGVRARGLRAALATALSLALAACASGARPSPEAGRAGDLVYVASQADASVSVLSATDGGLVAKIDLAAMGYGANARPHHVAVESDGSFWYVSLIGANRVLKLDRSNRVVGEAAFEAPGMLALPTRGELLYVGRSMAAVDPPPRVGMIDRATMSVDEVDVFFARPHALVVDARDRVHTASLAENRVASMPVGSEDVELQSVAGPLHTLVQFAVSPDGRWMVGTGQMSGRLLVWDVSRDEPDLVRSVEIGGQPWHPTFARGGAEVWVPNLTRNVVTVIDVADWSVSVEATAPALVEPHGSAVGPDGRTVYVTARNTSGAYGAGAPGVVMAFDVATRAPRWVAEVGAYAAGVAVGGALRPADMSALPEWARRTAPFPVSGPEGTAYDEPFLGGFNVPRPQLLDVDADGDDDLMLQELTGSVMYFERLPGAEPRYAWRSDRYQDLDVGEWYRFVDMDGDGDADLLAEEPYSYIRYYRNEGGPSQPRYVLVADTLRTDESEPLFADRQSIPNASDLDCDGRIDLLIGRLTGTISRYEEIDADGSGAPRFRLVTDRFEDIEIVAQMGSAHGANTMALGDVDGDGDDDLFWGDFFEPGVLFIENEGGCDGPSFRSEPVPIPAGDPLATSGYNAPTLGDVDGDGDADLLVGVLGGAFNPSSTAIANLHWLDHGPGGSFTDRTARLVGTIDVGSESVPVAVDLDGDGDPDLLVGNRIQPDDPDNGALYRFTNRGTAAAPALVQDGLLEGLGTGYHRVPAFGDLDGDGDLDAVVGTWLDRLAYYRNDGPAGVAALRLVDSAVATLPRGRNATPALADLDADGDLDLVVGESSGQLNYFRNEASGAGPRFVLVQDDWLGIDVGRRSLPVFEDLDLDGDLDLLVGSENEGVHVYRNEGPATAPAFVEVPGGLPVETTGFAAPTFADLDGDGDRDLILGGGGGGLRYYERR